MTETRKEAQARGTGIWLVIDAALFVWALIRHLGRTLAALVGK